MILATRLEIVTETESKIKALSGMNLRYTSSSATPTISFTSLFDVILTQVKYGFFLSNITRLASDVFETVSLTKPTESVTVIPNRITPSGSDSCIKYDPRKCLLSSDSSITLAD